MSKKDNSAVQIVDNTFFSIGFPDENWDELINRENYLSQIDDCFSTGTDILFLDGDEDAGKTTLCGQYSRNNSKRTISVFFNPLNSLDYKLEFYSTSIVNQIRNLLGESLNQDWEERMFGVEDYERAIFELRRKHKRVRDKVILIIDGLEERVKEKDDFVSRLLDIVPFGQEQFKIIITGEQRAFLSLRPKLKKGNIKSISLTGFSKPEIVKYLSLSHETSTNIKDLFQITRGLPGRLRTLKRVIEKDPDSAKNLPKISDYQNWIEIDCESVDLDIKMNNAIVGLFALQEKSFHEDQVAKICSVSTTELSKILVDITVLETSSSGHLQFVSNAHKRYFANKLRAHERQIQQLVIDYYISSETTDSIIELPKIFASRHDWLKIIDVLDDKFLPKILNNTGSLKIVNESLELGVRASQEMNKYNDLWRYSIQGGIVNELDNFLFWESEIEARISINDFIGATSLAQSAVLKVDRLRLLALIARRQKELSKKVDEELVKVIQDLYETTDLLSLGEKIYDIVADLIYAIPNLAIEMIEKSSDNVSEKSINDWVMAKLSMAAIDSNLKEGSSNPTKSRKLEALESLNNPKAKKISRAISFLVGNYSSIKVLDEVNKLSDSKEKLTLLRLWLDNNRRNIKDVEKVIDVALSELVSSSSETAVTLDVLKELSFQLPFIEDDVTKKELLKRFDTIESGLIDLGLTKNKYIYQLNIFHARYTLDKSVGISVINQIIIEVDEIEDPLVKLDAYAEVFTKLRIFGEDEIRRKVKFVYSRLFALSDELYRTTSNHYKISKYLLETIGKRNPMLALKLCEQFNTIDRREKAKMLILDSYLDNKLKYVKIEALKKIEESMYYDFSKTELIIRVLERYSEAKSLPYQTVKALFYFTNKAKELRKPSQRIFAYLMSYKIIGKNRDWKARLSNTFENQIYASWKLVEADWERIDIGFSICSATSQNNPEFAKKIFQESENLKSGSWIDSMPVAYTYMNSVKLILRTYLGLLITNSDKSRDYSLIEDLINRIPSESRKLRLWTELGLHSFSIRAEISKRVFNEHVTPLLQGMIANNLSLEEVLHSLTFIHLFDSELAMEYLDGVHQDDREEVLSNICDYYITKRIPYEYYDKKVTKFKATFSDLNKAINVLKQITTDSIIYAELAYICDAISGNKDVISTAQQNDLISKLRDIVESTLPDPLNIQHDGYKIVAQAKLAKIDKNLQNKVEYWEGLIGQADKIGNTSDMIFVKTILINEVPFGKIQKKGSVDIKNQLYEDIVSSLYALNSHYEFVQRVLEITDMMYGFNPAKWQELINKAFSVSSGLESGTDVYKSQKSIIDSMYRLDPNFAKKLVELVDKENYQSRLKERLHDHYKTLEISKKIKNSQELVEKEKENNRNIVDGVLMALRALNSDKLTTKKITQISGYLAVANKLPFHEVFPIYIYYLNNCIRTYRTTPKNSALSNLHRDNFEEAIKATNLIQLLSHKRKATEKSYRKFFIDEDFITNKVIRPGTREEALKSIRDWLNDEVSEFVIIADPYFEKEDLEILKWIKEISENLNVDILGSKMGQRDQSESEFREYWKKSYDELPPFTNVTFCWIPEDNNQTPFHDRWILTKNGGLRIGTSISSLGVKKDSEISIMKPSEALNIQQDIMSEYLGKKKKHVNNLRLAYRSFSL